MKLLLKLNNRKSVEQGFTLIELIAASIMTLFIVGAAGFGMTVMLREQTVATADSDIQYNLNRAVDFISEEVRQASSITTTEVWPTGQTVSCIDSPNRTFVLGLTIPPATTTNVVYFTETPPGSPWIGQSAIFRCGPAYISTGSATFSDCIDGSTEAAFISSNTCPSGFTKVQKSTDALVDLIASSSGLSASPCSAGFSSASPNFTNGFFVCVNSGNNKLVEIHAFASARAYVEARVGTLSAGSRYLDKSTYRASTQVYARSKGPVNFSSNSTATFSGTVEATIATSGTCNFPIAITGTSTTKAGTDNVTVVLNSSSSPSGSPVTLTPNGGSALAVASVSTTSNVATFSGGGCNATVTLNTL